MSTGALSSLGIGSSVLTYDIIEKLRAADEKGKIKPIEARLEKNLTQQKDLVAITSYLNILKSSASSLSGGTLFQQRTVSASGDESASISASAGVRTQEITIDVENVASRDIYQSNKFASSDTSLGAVNGVLNMTIDGETYSITATSSMTLSELASAITDKGEGKVEARVLNVGGTDPYRLIIQSSETGESQKIVFGGDTTMLSGLGLDDLEGANKDNKVLSAADALFKFNGISINRASNDISDITNGMSIKLNKKGVSTFRIEQDSSPIKDEINSFVTAYNDLTNNLQIALGYNSETKTSGTLQGVSQLTSVKSQLNRMLTFMDTEGRTLSSYGLSLNDQGLLEFNESTFSKKLSQNSSDVESFFQGITSYDSTQYFATGPVANGAIEIAMGNVTINGTSFALSLNGTPEENASLLRDTINIELASSGVIASLSQDGNSIALTRADGGEIIIEGDNNVLEQLGLSAVTTSGISTTNEGVFSKLSSILNGMLSKTDGSITLLDQQFSNNQKRLSVEKEKAVKQLDSKYAMMINQFASYDNMIAQLNSQFSALQSMIDAQMNSKK